MNIDMEQDKYNLERFITAQEYAYPMALKEVQAGRKQTHWMWYIFPQHKHLGASYYSEFYGLAGIDEAAAYLGHPELNRRLRAVTEAVLALPEVDIVDVFGNVDSVKLRSSMTLFDMVSPDDIYARVLDRFFHGRRDGRTLRMVSGD